MKQVIVFCLTLLVIFSCKKSSPVSYPSGPIEANVQLYSELGVQISGVSGVTVTIIDTINNSSALNLNLVSPRFQSTTDASGKCTFSNVPAGSYTFVFSKSGYGTIVQYNIAFFPETAPYILSVTMAATSSVIVSNLKFTPGTADTLFLTCNINQPLLSPYSSVRFFWGVDENISPDSNYVAMVLCNTLYNYNVLQSNLIGFKFVPTDYSRDSLGSYVNILPGAKIYAIAYGEVNDPTLYTNISYSIRQLQFANDKKEYPTGITKYPNLNTSIGIDTTSAIAP